MLLNPKTRPPKPLNFVQQDVKQRDGISHLPKLTKFGGTSFLERTTVREGAPSNTPRKISELLEIHSFARIFEFQYRTAMAFRENPDHHCHWITLTYRNPEPATWLAARRHIKQWLRITKDYHRRVLLPAQTNRTNPNEKPVYIIVEEEGELHGRKHFHVLWWSAYPHMQFHNHITKWKHGYQTIEALKTGDNRNLAIYIAKYANKSNGRIKCSYKFGLTTLISLLSLSHFHRLAMVNLVMAQKLLRRLSLTPNYPTSRTINYLISRQTLSITSPLMENPPHLPQVIGLPMNSFPPANNASPSPQYMASTVRNTVSKTLVKNAVREIRAAANGDLESPLHQTLPGTALFGVPYITTTSARLEKGRRTSLWFTKSQHPRQQNNRSRGNGIRLDERK